MKITIKNQYIVSLASWLNELELSGRDSRERSRFVKLLADRYQETEKFRQDLINKYGKKNKKGELVKSKDDKSIILEEETKDEFMKEIESLYDDDFEMDISHNSAVKMRDIILDTKYIFGPKESDKGEEKLAKVRQMNDYEKWCASFEGISDVEA